MYTASINTRLSIAARVLLYLLRTLLSSVVAMLRVPLFLCVVPAVLCIIVRDPPPSPSDYKYSYNIDDPTTGDSKSQHEERIGDVVSGAYSVVGPDGTKRTVEYTADAKNGFQAVVREDLVSKPVVSNPRTAARPVYAPTGSNANYITDDSAIYFSPGNNIMDESPFVAGQFFIPANTK